MCNCYLCYIVLFICLILYILSHDMLTQLWWGMCYELHDMSSYNYYFHGVAFLVHVSF